MIMKRCICRFDEPSSNSKQPAVEEQRPDYPLTMEAPLDETKRELDVECTSQAGVSANKRSLPVSTSLSDPTRRKLDHVKRKIHQAAVLELNLLNRAKKLRERRAAWTQQYQELSHQMPPDFSPVVLPPLFGDSLTIAKVSPPATPKSSNVTEQSLCPCPSPCLLDGSDDEIC